MNPKKDNINLMTEPSFPLYWLVAVRAMSNEVAFRLTLLKIQISHCYCAIEIRSPGSCIEPGLAALAGWYGYLLRHSPRCYWGIRFVHIWLILLNPGRQVMGLQCGSHWIIQSSTSVIYISDYLDFFFFFCCFVWKPSLWKLHRFAQSILHLHTFYHFASKVHSV